MRLCTRISAVLAVVVTVALVDSSRGAVAQPTPPSPLTAESFGIDFWGTDTSTWQQFLDMLDQDGVPIGLVGFGITSRAIRYLQLGNEPDAVGHFANNGGRAELYAQLLAATYSAAH